MTVPRFVFLDLETTGLDHKSDHILELGMVVTDRNLEVLATFGRTVLWPEIEYDLQLDNYEPPFGVSDVVVKMHKKSGLWQDSYRSIQSLRQVLYEASFWLGQQLFDAGRKVELCGNTIGFDIRFLYEADPGFLDIFHHRSVDVSSHRVLYEEWVENQEGPVEPMPVGNDLHRSVPDCLDSIEKLKFFKKKLYDHA